MSIPVCQRCNENDRIKLRKQYARNGVVQFMWFCTRCNHTADSKRPFVAKSKVDGWIRAGKIPSLDDIQTINDYREGNVCEVCGALGTEYHHWLPQCFSEVVENHSLWPGAYLCKKCHDIWHETVTPYLPGRGRTEYAQYTKEKYLWLEGLKQ